MRNVVLGGVVSDVYGAPRPSNFNHSLNVIVTSSPRGVDLLSCDMSYSSLTVLLFPVFFFMLIENSINWPREQ